LCACVLQFQNIIFSFRQLFVCHTVTALQGQTYQYIISESEVILEQRSVLKQTIQPIEASIAVHQLLSDEETKLPSKKCHAKGDSA